MNGGTKQQPSCSDIHYYSIDGMHLLCVMVDACKIIIHEITAGEKCILSRYSNNTVCLSIGLLYGCDFTHDYFPHESTLYNVNQLNCTVVHAEGDLVFGGATCWQSQQAYRHLVTLDQKCFVLGVYSPLAKVSHPCVKLLQLL